MSNGMNKQISTGMGIAVIAIAALLVGSLGMLNLRDKSVSKNEPLVSKIEKKNNGTKSLSRPDNTNYLITEWDFKEETKNWETYKNDQYGFEMKYPPGFNLTDESKSSEQVTPLPPRDLKGKIVASLAKVQCCQFDFEEGMELDIFFFDDVSRYSDSVESAYKSRVSLPGDPTFYYTDVDRYYYRNFEGVKGENLIKKDSDKSNRGDDLDLFLKTKKGFYYFRWNAVDPKNLGFKYDKYFIPMLSTFRYEGNTPK